MRLIDADELRKVIHCEYSDDLGILEKIDNAPTIIDCGEIDHETMGKIPYMDLRPRMTEDKLNEITSRVCDIFSGAKFYDCIFCKGEHCIDCVDSDTVYSLLDVIASLHNELYKQVKGEYYDYMFHWANLGYGGSPNDSMFKSGLEKAERNLMEHMRKSGQIMEEGESNEDD